MAPNRYRGLSEEEENKREYVRDKRNQAKIKRIWEKSNSRCASGGITTTNRTYNRTSEQKLEKINQLRS